LQFSDAFATRIDTVCPGLKVKVIVSKGLIVKVDGENVKVLLGPTVTA